MLFKFVFILAFAMNLSKAPLTRFIETKHAYLVTTYRHEFFGIKYLYGIQGIELDRWQEGNFLVLVKHVFDIFS